MCKMAESPVSGLRAPGNQVSLTFNLMLITSTFIIWGVSVRVHRMHAWSHRGRKRVLNPLELELRIVVGHHVGAKN